MTACPDQIMSLQALADGELDGVNSAAVEAHLRTCAKCAAEFERIVGVRTILAQSDFRHTAPQALRARITAMLDAEPAGPAASPVRSAPIWSWLGGATAGALAASLALLFVTPQLSAPAIEQELVASHVRSLLAEHLVDVRTSDHHVVKPWFNGKIDFAPPVVDLAASGFPLVGGRLDYVHGHVVPALVYQRRLHRMNLFVSPSSGGRDTRASFERRESYGLMHWRTGGLDYWLVSDVERADFEAFQSAFNADIGT